MEQLLVVLISMRFSSDSIVIDILIWEWLIEKLINLIDADIGGPSGIISLFSSRNSIASTPIYLNDEIIFLAWYPLANLDRGIEHNFV